MRVHFLPAAQKTRNDKAIEKLRRIGYVLFVLLMATLALGAKLYIWPPVAQTEPQLTSDDGQTIYSAAVVLAPDLVLSPAKITGTAQFITLGERRNAKRIDSTTLPDGTEVTLLRLESPTSAAPVAVVVVEAGDALVAAFSGQEWHGVARAKVNGEYPVDPDFTLSAGTPVYRESDRTSLAGFAIRTASGSAIVSAQDVVSKFPELNAER